MSDNLYLWASDEFIDQLGSKANIIKKKRYYQYQALYKAVIDNVSKESEVENTYNQWTGEIAAAIKSTYGFTPGEILVRLALGQQVAGIDLCAAVLRMVENVTGDGKQLIRPGIHAPQQSLLCRIHWSRLQCCQFRQSFG